MPRLIIVGGSPWIAFLARALEDSLGKDSEVYLVLYSPGRGEVILHNLFTDRINLSNSANSTKITRKYVGRSAELAKRRGVYIVGDPIIARGIRRVEQNLWRPNKVDQKVLEEPPRLEAPLKTPEAQAYIEFTLYSSPSASLSKALLRVLRRGRGLVTRRVELVVDEGRVKGVRTPAGFFESEYALIDEFFLLEKLGPRALPRWLPLTTTSCLKLAGPPTQHLVASERVIIDLAEDSMTACVGLPARLSDLEEATATASEALSSYIDTSQYLVRRAYLGVSVLSPDKSPLILSHDEWPEGLYAIVGCLGNCASLVIGLAETLKSMLEGGEGPYSGQRLREGAAFREYLGLPYILS